MFLIPSIERRLTRYSRRQAQFAVRSGDGYFHVEFVGNGLTEFHFSNDAIQFLPICFVRLVTEDSFGNQPEWADANVRMPLAARCEPVHLVFRASSAIVMPCPPSNRASENCPWRNCTADTPERGSRFPKYIPSAGDLRQRLKMVPRIAFVAAIDAGNGFGSHAENGQRLSDLFVGRTDHRDNRAHRTFC